MFTDRDVSENPSAVEEALKTADAFFASLVFDYDNVRGVARSALVRGGERRGWGEGRGRGWEGG